MFGRFEWCLVLVATLAMAGPVCGAEFFDDFDSYAPGTALHGVNGWAGWDNTASAGAPVSDAYAFSGTNSVEITGGADLVQVFSGADSGWWEFSTMLYIPSGGSGNNYFILLNQYAHGGAKTWAGQLNFNQNTGQIIPEIGGGDNVDIITDEWVELKFAIDLDRNTATTYYGDTLISADRAWASGGVIEIQGLDLYGNNASPFYYDDIRLAQIPTLTWNESGSNDWASANWAGGPPAAPDAMSTAVLAATNSDTVTVAADAAAYELTVNGGGIAIADGQSLTVRQSANFGTGTTLALGAGATLSAKGGSLDTLTTAGDATVDVTAMPMTVGTFNDGGIAGTFTKAGAGSLLMDNTTGTAVIASNTALKIAGGTLKTRGADPLGGATALELAGGTLTIDGIGGAGDITGFGEGSDYSLNSNDAAATAGMPVIVADELQITSITDSQSTSAYFNTPQDVTSFRVEFDYQLVDPGTNTAPADGVALVFQNAGLDALGAGGGGRGYLNISSSAAVSLNLWSSRSDIDEGLNGSMPQGGGTGDADAARRHPTAPVDLKSGNVIHTTVAYNGATITVDLEDMTTGSTHSTSWDVDIPAAVGADTAWFGFTGGTGGAQADQRITNFSNSFEALPIELEGTDVLVSADSTLNPMTATTAKFGNLTLAGGVLSTQGAVLGGVTFLKTDIDPAATAVGIDPQVPTDFGVIDAQGANVTFVKGGPSTWVIEDVNPVSNMGPDADWEVRGGILELKGANPVDGRPITVSGGTLTMVGGEQLNGAPVTLNGGSMVIQASGELVVGDINGFGDGSDYTLNSSADALTAGVPVIDAGELQITSAANNQGTSAYFNTPQDITFFRAEFDYQMVAGTAQPADGVALVFQNAGLNALGAAGGGRGYTGIGDSAAVSLNLWQGRSDVDEGLNGVLPTGGGAGALRYPTAPVDLKSSNVIHTTVDYDGTTVTVNLEDMTTGGTFTKSWDVDIPAAVGDSAAYIGFTGGTGGANADQRISNFSMAYASEGIDLQDIDILVTDDSLLQASTPTSATFGGLTLQNGIFSVRGGVQGGVSFAGTTIASTATSVGLDTQTNTQLGVINVESPAVAIAKTGSGDLVLTESNVGTGFENATFTAQEGRLVGVNGFGAAGLGLGGGELVLAGSTTGGAQVYDNALVVDANSTLTAGPGGAGAAGPVDVTLGSAANGVTLNGADLLLRATDGYTLTVGGPVTGSGEINLPEGAVTLAGGGDVTSAKINGGTLNTGADLSVAEMVITSGTVNTGASKVIVSDVLKFESTPYLIDSEHTFTAEGADLLSGTTLTLNGGVLNVGIGDVSGGIAGFGDGSQYTLNASADAQTAGVPIIDGGDLQITSAANNQGTSVYFNTPQDIRVFRVEFDYQMVDGTAEPADGMALVVQNAGLNALGATGGGRGYLNITDSVAVSLNLWQSRSDIDEGLNGVLPSGGGTGGAGADQRHATAPLDLKSGNVIHTTVDYDGTAITVDLEDMTTGDTYTESWEVDIPTAVGGNAAYIGFTGGTGGANADQMITNFEFYYPLDPIEAEFISLAVTDDTVLVLNTTEDASFGDLAVDPGKSLTVENVAASFNDVTVGGGASLSIEALLVAGTLSTGGNPGAVTIDGELEFDDTGVFLVDPSADVLTVTADVFLSGSLELKAGGPMGDLSAGEWGTSTRTILSTSGAEGAIVDTFASEPAAGDHVGSGVFFESLAYTPEGDEATDVEVTVFQAAPGDVNGDQKVDNADLQGILGAGSFGTGDGWGWTEGDFNANGTVGNDDLQLILATGLFGAGTYAAGAGPAGAGLVAVPEPGTLMLLASGLFGLLCLWRRRRAT